MARRLGWVAVAGGVVVTACGHPDDNATQVLTQGLHSESGIQPEANTLGMVSGSGGRGTALSQVLESVVQKL